MSFGNTDMALQAAVMLHNLGTIAVIVNMVSIMTGVGLVSTGLFSMKRYGEMRTFMSHQMTIWMPLAQIFGGIMCLMLPTMITTILRAFWGEGQTMPLAYTGTGLHDIDVYVPVVNAFIRLIGVGAIIRAAVLFARSGSSGHQPGILGKAILHVFGGIFCIHILGTVHLIKYIFNISS